MHNWMRAEPLELTLNRLADSGYESIEIRGEPMRYDTKQVLSLLERYGLRCWGSVTMMTSGRDLVHEDPYVRLGTIQYMKDTVRMISELGGSVFCIVPSTVGKLEPMAPPEQEWAWAVEGLRQVLDVARSLDVRIGVEPLNRFETYFINRHDQALQLARDVGGNCGIVLDTFHMNIEEVDPMAAIGAARDNLIDFHVADNNRFPPGQGRIDWRLQIAALKEIGYDGALTAEFVMPMDRTPPVVQNVEEGVEMTQGMEEFVGHLRGSVLAEEYFSRLVRETAEFLQPLI